MMQLRLVSSFSKFLLAIVLMLKVFGSFHNQMLAKKVETLTKAMEIEAKKMRREVAAMEKEVAAMRVDKEHENKSKRLGNSKTSVNSSHMLPGR